MTALSLSITRADRTLVRLMLVTMLLGGLGTLAVVFLADVLTARMANPTGVAGVEPVTMSEVAELHHWIGYKVALAARDDKDVVYHVGKALATATDAKQRSALDGVLVEHMPAGHFVHTKNILKDLLGTKQQPVQTAAQLEASLALALIKQNQIDQAKEQLSHMLTVPIPGQEVAQEALAALEKGDLDSARQLLTGLSGAQ